jgi:hypothetical protein
MQKFYNYRMRTVVLCRKCGLSYLLPSFGWINLKESIFCISPTNKTHINSASYILLIIGNDMVEYEKTVYMCFCFDNA